MSYLRQPEAEKSVPDITYTYKATLIRVVDGDTVDLSVDCGFRNFRRDRFRIKDIDTPELRGRSASERAHAIYAVQYLKSILKDRELRIRSYKMGVYGRWEADLWTRHPVSGQWHDLAWELAQAGFVKKESYDDA